MLTVEEFAKLVAKLPGQNARKVLHEVVTAARFTKQTSDDVTHTPSGLRRERADSVAILGFCTRDITHDPEKTYEGNDELVIRGAFLRLGSSL